MRRDELIRIKPFPAVVQAARVRELRQVGNCPDAVDFVSGYLGYDGRSRHALTEALTCLVQREHGGAFWLNGVFGCGKSHLLGVLALLSDGIGREEFAGLHPFLSPLLNCIPARFVVHFSLDDYDSARWSLEAVFWKEVHDEWRRRDFGELEFDWKGSRAETFAVFEGELEARGLLGVTVCIDELSLFLGGRDHHGLQSDAAFLQFLGQHARRSSLCVFAALQKNVEDISGLESYSLTQIRDRYTTLSLALANLPAILEHRLVNVLDEERLGEICSTSWGALSGMLPRPDFGPQEWRATYPFHPTTLSLAEQVVSRFFSRTRSAIIFCSGAVDGAEAAETRVMPDALFDYVEPEFESHPDLRPLSDVWDSWRGASASLSTRDGEAQDLLRVMKLLLLCKVGGITPTPIQMANALILDGGLIGEGNYEYARHLLEKLRTKAAFLAVERAEDPLQDRYAVDTGQRVGEMLRRHLQASLETLEPDDVRVPRVALESCRDEPLPLAELISGPRSYALFWQNTPRRVLVEIWAGGGSDAISNRVAALCEPGAPDDALLVISPPFGSASPELEQLVARLPADNRPALWLWKPRSPLKDEIHLAREVTAASLLEGDPQLLDNRKGRAVLDRLRADAPGRLVQLQRVVLRLLREGMIYLGHGPVLEAAELAAADTWIGLLEAVGDFSFPHLFPNQTTVSPRARMLTPSNADALCLEILRRPMEEPYFAPSLERLARHIGEPLGVASPVAGRWKIDLPEPELRAVLMEQVGSGLTLASLDGRLAKRPWGLRAEQTSVTLCALLRAGELAAFDNQGRELVPAHIGLPLRRSVHSLRPGRLVSAEAWNYVSAFLSVCGSGGLGGRGFEEQEKARLLVLEYRERLEAELNLSRARAAQLRRQLGHKVEQWGGFEAACATVSGMLDTMPSSGTALEVLEAVLSVDMSAFAGAYKLWRDVADQLEAKLFPLLTQHALLSHPDLVCPSELTEERTELLSILGAGEAVLEDETLLNRLAGWGDSYRRVYGEWHAAQHQIDRWNSLRRLSNSDLLRAMELLGGIRNRPFPGGGEVRRQLNCEMEKHCGRNIPLGSGEAVCCSCGLRHGARVEIVRPDGMESLLNKGVEVLRQTLRETAVADFLARSSPAWTSWDGEPESLLTVLSPESLAQLDEALQPRRRVERRWPDLLLQFEDCRTRREYESRFSNWLDAGENIAPDDVVTLVL